MIIVADSLACAAGRRQRAAGGARRLPGHLPPRAGRRAPPLLAGHALPPQEGNQLLIMPLRVVYSLIWNNYHSQTMGSLLKKVTSYFLRVLGWFIVSVVVNSSLLWLFSLWMVCSLIWSTYHSQAMCYFFNKVTINWF